MSQNFNFCHLNHVFNSMCIQESFGCIGMPKYLVQHVCVILCFIGASLSEFDHTIKGGSKQKLKYHIYVQWREKIDQLLRYALGFSCANIASRVGITCYKICTSSGHLDPYYIEPRVLCFIYSILIVEHTVVL